MIYLLIYRLQHGVSFPKESFVPFPSCGNSGDVGAGLAVPSPLTARVSCRLYSCSRNSPPFSIPSHIVGLEFSVSFVLLIQSFCWAIAKLTGFYSPVLIASRNFLPRTCHIVTGQRCHQAHLAFHFCKLPEEECSSPRTSLFQAPQMLRAIASADGESINDSTYGRKK